MARDDRRRLAAIRETITTRLWPIPAAAIVVGIALGVVLPVVDNRIAYSMPPTLSALLFSGGTDAARAVLSAISGSLVSAASLTFSLTVVALQLASSQASPRLLRLFARDRVVQATLSLFLGTFAFALGVLRTVEDSTDASDASVPRVSVSLAIVLTLVSVIQLVLFLAHLARQLRVETMLAQVHAETAETIALVRDGAAEPERTADAPADRVMVCATRSGFLTFLDRDRLIAVARELDVVIREERGPGENVVAGTPLASWWSVPPGRLGESADRKLEKAIADAHHLGHERTSSQDVGFGLRQLSDVAVKALSPGINDPTTAIHALGHISAVLCEIVSTHPAERALTDADGRVRLHTIAPDFRELIEESLTQIRRYGASDPMVLLRIAGLLREVAFVDSGGRFRNVIHDELARWRSTVDAGDFDATERERFDRAEAAAEHALDGRWS